MQVSDSITKIRRIIRDRDSNVFTDEMILRVWSKVQQQFCMETGILQSAIALPVPATAECTFTHRWEENLGSRVSNILYNFIHQYTITQPWEVCSVINSDEPLADGGITSTQQWESVYATIQNRLPHYFPDDYVSAMYMAYDEKPMDFIYMKDADQFNPSFKSRFGQRPYVYVEDIESNTFYLYPKVIGTYGITDMGDVYGVVVYDEDDVINPTSDNYGCITYSETLDIDSNYGCVVYYETTADSIYLIYRKKSRELGSVDEDIEVHDWCVKYIEFEVMSQLLAMDTDLYNKIISKHFNVRYKMGISSCKVFLANAKTLREYKFKTGNTRRRGEGAMDPSLPSEYPRFKRRGY